MIAGISFSTHLRLVTPMETMLHVSRRTHVISNQDPSSMMLSAASSSASLSQA